MQIAQVPRLRASLSAADEIEIWNRGALEKKFTKKIYKYNTGAYTYEIKHLAPSSMYQEQGLYPVTDGLLSYCFVE